MLWHVAFWYCLCHVRRCQGAQAKLDWQGEPWIQIHHVVCIQGAFQVMVHVKVANMPFSIATLTVSVLVSSSKPIVLLVCVLKTRSRYVVAFIFLDYYKRDGILKDKTIVCTQAQNIRQAIDRPSSYPKQACAHDPEM